MPNAPSSLARALDAVQEELYALAWTSQELVPPAERLELDEQSMTQFVRAFTVLLREALDGRRDQRDAVMETAVPALVAAGRGPMPLLQGTVTYFVLTVSRLLEEVSAHEREEARRWLAQYAAEYTREVVEHAAAAAGE